MSSKQSRARFRNDYRGKSLQTRKVRQASNTMHQRNNSIQHTYLVNVHNNLSEKGIVCVVFPRGCAFSVLPVVTDALDKRELDTNKMESAGRFTKGFKQSSWPRLEREESLVFVAYALTCLVFSRRVGIRVRKREVICFPFLENVIHTTNLLFTSNFQNHYLIHLTAHDHPCGKRLRDDTLVMNVKLLRGEFVSFIGDAVYLRERPTSKYLRLNIQCLKHGFMSSLTAGRLSWRVN